MLCSRFQVALYSPRLGISFEKINMTERPEVQKVSDGSILVAKFVHKRMSDKELADNSVGMI